MSYTVAEPLGAGGNGSSGSRGYAMSQSPVVALGFASEFEHTPALQLTWSFAARDVYLELPRQAFGDVDAGAGITWYRGGVLRGLAPYLQTGRVGVRQTGWFTQQGVHFGRDVESGRWRAGWSPNVGVVFPPPARMRVIYVSLVPLSVSASCRTTTGCSALRNEPYLMIGMTSFVRMPDY